MGPIEQTGWGPALPAAELVRPDPSAAAAPLPLLIGGGPSMPFTWHLSVINAGWPRGDRADLVLSQDQLAEASYLLDIPRWTVQGLDQGQWRIISTEPGVAPSDARAAFNIEGATALAGDFNGDGRDQLALFYRGEWLIDINGNGVWDDQDLWVRLGAEDDLPVVGDWDGDGKDDIGIFGPAWSSDLGRIPNESGLPSLENERLTDPKNMPPELARRAELHETRMLVRTAQGVGRADVIDHVFGLGLARDLPVAGDFNGDGISTIGVFRDGRWIIDIDGDGQLTDRDVQTVFGQPGDVPMVGDFDGQGIDQIAVLRGNRLIVDTNRNFQLDAEDQFIEVDAEAGQVVIGDFDGDGIDEPAVHRGGAALEGLLEARRLDGSLR